MQAWTLLAQTQTDDPILGAIEQANKWGKALLMHGDTAVVFELEPETEDLPPEYSSIRHLKLRESAHLVALPGNGNGHERFTVQAASERGEPVQREVAVLYVSERSGVENHEALNNAALDRAARRLFEDVSEALERANAGRRGPTA